MRYNPLGRTDISVSRICLGTMTFGEQNSEADAFAQMDRAVESGVTFFDTAELYPVPPRADTAGRTEAMIGAWLKARRQRARIVLATKIAGPGIDHLRSGSRVFDRATLRRALEGSLTRLGTDHVDLFQLHWPERKTNTFGRLGFASACHDEFTPLGEVLDGLADLVTAGLVRAVGVSNETPWGTMTFLAEAMAVPGRPRIASIQNPYSLLNRTFEIGLAEVTVRENCGLLAYSPLGFGVLSGKYLHGARPPGARLTLFPTYKRYSSANPVKAPAAYVELAHRHGLDPAQMALAYILSRPFVTSVIIGATTVAQLDSNLGAINLRLDSAIIAEIEAIHAQVPNPAP